MQTRRPEQPAARHGGPLLVQSRLRPPAPRVPWVRRLRLLSLLREGAKRPLTVVSAPPGYGKTILLAQWAREDARRMPFAWVTLAEDSQHPATFLFYVIEALRSVDPRFGRQARRRLGGMAGDQVAEAMPALLNDIAALPHRATLVIDDLDAMQEPETQHWMGVLLDNLSGPLHVAIATRSAPLLRIGRLRAQGELTELSADDLRFTEDEARSLLDKRMGLDVDEADLASLNEATEGWPTGVYLGGMYLASGPERVASDFRGTHRHVADFLRDEVLHRQPEPIREFMLRTSILDRLSPGLCDEVSRTEGASLMLGDLERSNLFVVPLDDVDEWYRYQLLFRDMLRSEAARLIPSELAELHRRASLWHQRHGTVMEAVHHALAAGDEEMAVGLVKSNWVVVARSGYRATVWSWFQSLPWQRVRQDPHLCAIAAFLLVYGGEFDMAEVWASRIPERLPASGPLPDGFSSVESIRQLVLSHPVRNVGAALRASRRVVELERPESEWHSAGLIALGINQYVAGHLAEARTNLEAARIQSATAPRPAVEMLALTFLSLLEHDVGDPMVGDQLAIEARRLMDEYDVVDYPILAPLHMASAIAFSRSDPDAVESEMAEALRLAAPYGRSIIPALTALLGARVRLSLGDVAGCRDLLRAANESLGACSDSGTLRQGFASLDARTRPRATRQDLPEALTASEIAVLRLLATDLSLGEIAARLFVSINTIKTHTRHIYQKLQAPSRRVAVDEARRLDLI
ncbi:MAG TPA: LuxR C-terminal-related transcriptional regulator [Actinomycetota bacterium]